MFKVICHLAIVQFVMVGGFVFGETDDLAELLMNADEAQFTELFPRGIIFESVVRRIEPLLPRFQNEIQQTLPPDAKLGEKLRLANRQANAAAVLFRMDKSERGLSVLKHSPNPTARTFLIHRLRPLGISANKIFDLLNDQQDISIRRALILSLGEFDQWMISQEERRRFAVQLQEIYQTTPDAGLHAACEWLLRQWNQKDWLKQIDQKSPNEKDRGKSEWYISGQGQSMVVISGPVSFSMGSPTKEYRQKSDETAHIERIERRFAICSKEVTVEEFLRFKEMHYYVEHHAQKADCPVNNVTWYDAVEYCNWLNVQEEIPKEEWCYEPNKDGGYKEGMRLIENHLKRRGYRLPTEAEWEYTCRAGAETQFSFGESEVLLVRFANFQVPLSPTAHVRFDDHMTYPVGSLKPNDLGMFDVEGNVREWCEDIYRAYDNLGKSDGIVEEKSRRVLRGGSFTDPSWKVRSATRDFFPPWVRDSLLGFRIARTLPE